MPKVKSKRSALKRFKITGTGKVKRFKAFKSHLLAGKSAKRRRNLRKADIVSSADLKRVRKALPNSF